MGESSSGQVLGGAAAGVTSFSSSSTLSMSEMRERRLAALAGGISAQQQRQQHSGTISEQPAARRRRSPSQSVAAARITTSQKDQVIDLCDSSDEDDEMDRKKPAASEETSSRSNKRARLHGSATAASASSARRSTPSSSSSSWQGGRGGVSRPLSSVSGNTARSSSSVRRMKDCRFQVGTYNLWFDPVHQPVRMRGVSNVLLKQAEATAPPLWLVGFQEVTDSLAAHLFPRLEKAGYTIERQNNGVPYGCALAVFTGGSGDNGLVILDTGFEPFHNSMQGRGILHVTCGLPDGSQVLFCTTHLESWCGSDYTGSTQRHAQALSMQNFCRQQLRRLGSKCTVILTGDWNWDDVRPRSAGPDPVLLTHLNNHNNEARHATWKDAWLECHPNTRKEPGYTYDSKENPMLRGSLRRRFDRVLVLPPSRPASGRQLDGGTAAIQKTTSVQIVSATIAGTESLPGYEYEKKNQFTGATSVRDLAPSDHFALLVQLQTKTA